MLRLSRKIIWEVRKEPPALHQEHLHLTLVVLIDQARQRAAHVLPGLGIPAPVVGDDQHRYQRITGHRLES